MTKKILIVEDERPVALDIQRRLLQMGYEVPAVVECEVDAIAAMRAHQPDLVLMDIILKNHTSGIRLALQIDQEFQRPVIFLTAHIDEQMLNQATVSNPYGYLIKPVDSRSLRSEIEVALTRQEAERCLQNSLRREQELTELKSQFVSLVSHEFRNPLSVIKLSFDLLKRSEPGEIPAAKQAIFDRGKAAVQQMNNLLEEVLLLSKIETGQLSFNPQPIDVLWFCEDLIAELNMEAERADRVRLVKQPFQSPNAPFYNLDVFLLRHILINLLSNALKYSPQRTSVLLTVGDNSEQIQFQVQDQGIGIPPEEQTNLGKPFYRCQNVGKVQGTGLGFAIAKQCAQAHRGFLEIRSTLPPDPQQGTLITLTLPLHVSLPGYET